MHRILNIFDICQQHISKTVVRDRQINSDTLTGGWLVSAISYRDILNHLLGGESEIDLYTMVANLRNDDKSSFLRIRGDVVDIS